MAVTKPLRVGVVGCGTIAQSHHIPSLVKVRDAEVVAVCDTNQELARLVAKRFNINKHYGTLAEMLETKEVDMVDICTPPQTHLMLSLSAIERGCHVLVEKPMTLSLKEADEMVAASKANGVKLCVAHSMLFYSPVMKAESMVREGRIGEVIGIDMRMSIPRDDDRLLDREHWFHKLPGGVLAEMLPHPVSLAQAFLGSLEPTAVDVGKLGSYDWVVPDELRVILKGKKGIATIACSCNWVERVIVFDTFGTAKDLVVDLRNNVLITRGRETSSLRALSRNLGDGSQYLAGAVYRALQVIAGRLRIGHYILIRRFIESIQNDTEPPVTVEQCREVVRVCEKIVTQMSVNQRKD